MSALTRRAVLGAALAAGLAGCARQTTTGTTGSSSAAPDPTSAAASPTPVEDLTVGLTYVPDIQFAPLYMAEHFGWFTEEGLSVTLRHHGAQEKLLGALQTGDEDVVFAGGGEMLQGRGEGIPVRNFATVYQTYPVTIVVPEASPIQTLADLAGHSVGLPGEYGENWFYLLAALGQAGLSRDDLDIRSIGYTQFAALTGGQIDAIVGFVNNDVVRFQEAGFPIRTLSVDEPPLVSVGFGALDATLAARKFELVAMLRAIGRGAEFCKTDPAQAVEIAARYVPTLVEPEQQAHAVAVLKATTALFGDHFGEQDPARWHAMAQFFIQHQLVATPTGAVDVFTTDIAGGGETVGPR